MGKKIILHCDELNIIESILNGKCTQLENWRVDGARFGAGNVFCNNVDAEIKKIKNAKLALLKIYESQFK